MTNDVHATRDGRIPQTGDDLPDMGVRAMDHRLTERDATCDEAEAIVARRGQSEPSDGFEAGKLSFGVAPSPMGNIFAYPGVHLRRRSP